MVWGWGTLGSQSEAELEETCPAPATQQVMEPSRG